MIVGSLTCNNTTGNTRPLVLQHPHGTRFTEFVVTRQTSLYRYTRMTRRTLIGGCTMFTSAHL